MHPSQIQQTFAGTLSHIFQDALLTFEVGGQFVIRHRKLVSLLGDGPMVFLGTGPWFECGYTCALLGPLSFNSRRPNDGCRINRSCRQVNSEWDMAIRSPCVNKVWSSDFEDEEPQSSNLPCWCFSIMTQISLTNVPRTFRNNTCMGQLCSIKISTLHIIVSCSHQAFKVRQCVIASFGRQWDQLCSPISGVYSTVLTTTYFLGVPD